MEIHYTKIGDLSIEHPTVNIIGRVIRVTDPFNTKTGKTTQMFLIEDDTGEVHISLWDEDIKDYRVGDLLEVRYGKYRISEYDAIAEIILVKKSFIKILERAAKPAAPSPAPAKEHVENPFRKS